MLPLMAMVLCLSTLVVETQGAITFQKTKGDGQPLGLGIRQGNTVYTDQRLEMALQKIAYMDAEIRDLNERLDETNDALKEYQDRDRSIIDKMQKETQRLIVQSEVQHKMSEDQAETCDRRLNGILQVTSSNRLENVERQMTSIVTGVINITLAQLDNLEKRVNVLSESADNADDSKGRCEQLAWKILALEQEQMKQKVAIDGGVEYDTALQERILDNTDYIKTVDTSLKTHRTGIDERFEEVIKTLAMIDKKCDDKSQHLEKKLNSLQASTDTSLIGLAESLKPMKQALQKFEKEHVHREELEASVKNLQTMLSEHVDYAGEMDTYWARVSAEYFDPFSTGLIEWRLAFKGTAAIGKSVFDAYVNSAPMDGVEPGCKQLDTNLPCRHHYRNNVVLDNWGTNIQEVALVVLQGGKPVHHVIFDGRNTGYTNWMTRARVKSSSWKDVKRGPQNYFGVGGDGRLSRRFFISRNYGGCAKDAGWFVAVDPLTRRPCGWEKEHKLPTFHFARGTTFANWSRGKVGIADAMAVLVKYSKPWGPIG